MESACNSVTNTSMDGIRGGHLSVAACIKRSRNEPFDGLYDFKELACLRIFQQFCFVPHGTEPWTQLHVTAGNVRAAMRGDMQQLRSSRFWTKASIWEKHALRGNPAEYTSIPKLTTGVKSRPSKSGKNLARDQSGNSTVQD